MNLNISRDFVVDFSTDPITGKENHIYTLRGKPLTGATTILKVIGKGDSITQWAANNAAKKFSECVEEWLNTQNNDEFPYKTYEDLARFAWKGELEKAGLFGKHVHGAVEAWVKGKDIQALEAKELKAFERFKKWVADEKVKVLSSELSVYNEEHWYSGTIDLILEIDGKVWIGDIKTSASIYPEHFFQTAAYQCALKERGFDREIYGHVIINLQKTGGFKVERSYGYDKNLEGFLSALNIYRIKQDLIAQLQ